jgi:hypothetical protein
VFHSADNLFDASLRSWSRSFVLEYCSSTLLPVALVSVDVSSASCCSGPVNSFQAVDLCQQGVPHNLFLLQGVRHIKMRANLTGLACFVGFYYYHGMPRLTKCERKIGKKSINNAM